MIIKFDYAEFILQVMMDLKNVFAHQPTFKVLELKKTTKVLNILLVGNQIDDIILNSKHYMVLFYLMQNILGRK